MSTTFAQLWRAVEPGIHIEAVDLAIDWVVEHTDADSSSPTDQQLVLQTIWELAYRLAAQGEDHSGIRSQLRLAWSYQTPEFTALAESALDNAIQQGEADRHA